MRNLHDDVQRQLLKLESFAFDAAFMTSSDELVGMQLHVSEGWNTSSLNELMQNFMKELQFSYKIEWWSFLSVNIFLYSANQL